MTRPNPFLRLARDRAALFGMVVLGAVTAVAAAAPLLPLADPQATDLSLRLLPPGSEAHILGTDPLGRDILSRLVWGTRTSLAVGFLAMFVAAVTGTLIGLLAAYYGRLVDTLLMRGIDVLMAFPYLLLALAIVAVLGPGLRNAMIAIAIVNVPFFARTVRGAALSLRERDFVPAARLAGEGDLRILFTEIFPNVLPALAVLMATTVGWMVLETAGLSFLGLGAQPPGADLGSMLAEGRQLMTVAPHVAAIPGATIFVIVLAVNLLGDGIRDALDPRLTPRQRRRRSAPEMGDEVESARMAGSGREGARQDPSVEPGRSAAAAGPPPLLQVTSLATWFFTGGRIHRAVDGVDLRIGDGEALGVVGESGSGKSVTALSILGLVPTPSGRVVRGQILFRGEELRKASPRRLRALRGTAIGYIPQDPMTALDPVFTVGDQVQETLRVHRRIGRKEARDRTVALFEQVQLRDPSALLHRYPHELSGGMRQRVLIAAALANDPALLIADEPTTALDAAIRKEILELLDRLRRERGASLLFITHDFGSAHALCDRIAVMYAGRVVEHAPSPRLFADPRHPYTRGLLAAMPRRGDARWSVRPLSGQPPPPDELPAGCRFAPRCELALDACRQPPIGFESVDEDHQARCIRALEDIVPGPLR